MFPNNQQSTLAEGLVEGNYLSKNVSLHFHDFYVLRYSHFIRLLRFYSPVRHTDSILPWRLTFSSPRPRNIACSRWFQDWSMLIPKNISNWRDLMRSDEHVWVTWNGTPTKHGGLMSSESHVRVMTGAFPWSCVIPATPSSHWMTKRYKELSTLWHPLTRIQNIQSSL